MNRRNVIKMAASALAVGGVGAVTLAKAFKPQIKAAPNSERLIAKSNSSDWKYTPLNPELSSRAAYLDYSVGSCMYGVFSGIISQLKDKVGEPFTSFPTHMMKYGHGGIGGIGTICGTLNGAAAIIGLVVNDKSISDLLIADLFRWYESTSLPTFKPEKPVVDFLPAESVSESVLCHASTTKWGKKSGFRIDSKERKERCRRLTAEVAGQTVLILNSYFNNGFMSHTRDNETVRTCMTCHGSEGKLGNTAGQMNCTSCHDKSVGHKVFGDVHYKFMDKR